MRIGMAFGGMLPQGNLDNDHLCYAEQLGITDIVLHLPDSSIMPSLREGYFGLDDLLRIKKMVNGYGLQLEAIENFPAHMWYDILLGGPARKEQMEKLKISIANMGKAGIPVMGYYFSIAGVWGRTYGPYARGKAQADAFSLFQQKDLEEPLPDGMVWGVEYTKNDRRGFVPYTTKEEVWERLAYFLKEIIPVAEEAGVKLAAHPDDPPVRLLRRTGRIITHADDYQQLLDLYPSANNTLEFCQGTMQYMEQGNIYETIKHFASQGKIAYVHIRNSRGRMPEYHESFIDDGDIDIIRSLRIYARCGFNGVIIPDHVPEVKSSSPFLTSFAYTIGYLKAALTCVLQENDHAV